MDEDRPLFKLKTKTAASKDRASSKPSSQPKSLLRSKGVEPLTPLHRLAKFKEVRDRNLALARDRNVRKSRYSVKSQSTLFAQPRAMEAIVNGVNKNEVTATKSKTVERMPNGSENTKHTNGVEHSTDGEELTVPKTVAGDVTVTNGNKSPTKPDENPKEKEVAPEASDAVETPESEGESESDAGEAAQESEGSSLDVVGGSSAESLDLQVSRQSSFDDLDDETEAAVPSSTKSPESVPDEPAPSDDPPTPEFIKRLNATGGKISSRRCLRGEYFSPHLKRKLDSEDDHSGAKRTRDDGTLSSPGWKFFSPTRTISKFWSPFSTSPTKVQAPVTTPDVDESMVVNVDDQSNFFENIEDDTAATLIQDSQEKPAQKWCAIM